MLERIEKVLNETPFSRYCILFGSGMGDVFVTPDLQEHSLEHAILEALREQGFERVVFTSPHRSLYFLDECSAALTLPSPGQEPQICQTGMRHLKSGPFADRMLFTSHVSERQENSLDAMGDVLALRAMHALMEQKEIRTAVIFVQAETTLSRFEDPRTLAGLVGAWSRLPSDNRNRAFFLFSAGTGQQLNQAAEHLPIPELRSVILEQSAPSHETLVAALGGPTVDEIRNIILLCRERNNLLVQPEELEKLSRLMTGEGIMAREWLTRLQIINHLDFQMLRSHGWISAQRDREKSAFEQLERYVGLDDVKERIKEISSWLMVVKNRREGKLPDLPLMHMIFTGNPGTGKTSVARLFGEMLNDLGLLERGHLVEVSGSDLLADHVGGTALKTNSIIDSALDGVLFIDEAYALSAKGRGGFGAEALEALLTRLENDRSRLVVILAGYPERMEHFLDANPGIRRRFPPENLLEFPDFTPGQLWHILQGMLEELQLKLSPIMEESLKEVIDSLHGRRDENFGNAGEMRNLAEALDRRRSSRIVSAKLPLDAPLQVCDIPETYRLPLHDQSAALEDLFTELDALTGLQEVKAHLHGMVDACRYDRVRQGQDASYKPDQTLQHLVFVGNPGTGKTTVARLVGRIYQALGLLPRGHCVEVSRADLVAEYVGQTAQKTRDKVRQALGGVLFIDEAYSLSQGGVHDFGAEALDVLVKLMEDYHGRLLVIAAGYPTRMQAFLCSNPGLGSRFAKPIPFRDFSRGELGQILADLSRRQGYTLQPEVLEAALDTLEYKRLTDGAHFGNARSALNQFNSMKQALASRVVHDEWFGSARGENLDMITFQVEDVGFPGKKEKASEMVLDIPDMMVKTADFIALPLLSPGR